MLEQLQIILSEAIAEISKATSLEDLDNLRVSYLGKKGRLTLAAGKMKDLSKEERPNAGKKLNETRSKITQSLEEKINHFQQIEDSKERQSLDPTLPSNPIASIGRHPISQMLDQAIKALRRMGFALASGPEIETEWHCFDALNTPQDHPARNESDTFYFDDGKLLRTHTSTIQIRTMENTKPPVRIIAPGAAYRRDEIDATHLSQFNQLEGLYVDKDVSFADLKQMVLYFAKSMFGKSKLRFRPSYFPFTEPSAEVDIYWGLETETDHRITKGTGWLEIMGCGMVDPNVLQNCNIDSEKYTGYAFGLGLERIAMLIYQIPDIRLFFENDVRFLNQFK